MICAELVENTLHVVDIASNSVCPFIELLESSDSLAQPKSVLTPKMIAAMIGGAVSIYGLVFVINAILITLGYKR